jgi:uncharacterized protein YggE
LIYYFGLLYLRFLTEERLVHAFYLTAYFNYKKAYYFLGNLVKTMQMVWGLMLLAALSCTASGQEVGLEGGVLTVFGEGKVTVPADVTNIAVSAQSSNVDLTQAEAEAQETLNRTIEALMAVGVTEEQILSGQSSGRSTFQSQSKVCRTVNNTTVCDNTSYDMTTLEKSAVVRLQTADEGRINEVLKAARSQGAKATVMGYGLSDVASASAEAREKAVENARQSAESIAAAAEVRLGNALEVSDYAYPDISSAATFGYESSKPGNVDVTAIVLVTYELIA